ncbi:hypothetical protein V1517DRAFT_330190 [Lipomyces orientalis]|uniref:Uncharacterized protein n=1 Tax=Lipomyces orientalis TaxID=1233043 RepID=A0ACC3THF8_9ASCO
MTKKKNKQRNLNEVSNSGSEGSSKQTPCYFYKQGNCAKGESCPFLHEGADKSSQARPTKYSNALNVVDNSDFSISDFDRQELHEITSRPPVYFYSSFAVTKGGRRGIINDRDISPEELRYFAYESKRMGEFETYEAIADIARQDMLNLFEFISNNMDKAERYIEIARQRSDSEIRNFLPPEEVHSDNSIGLLAIRFLKGDTSAFDELKKRIREKKTTNGSHIQSSTSGPSGETVPQTSPFGNAQKPSPLQASAFGARLGGTAQPPAFQSSPVPEPTTNYVAPVFGSSSFGVSMQQQSPLTRTSAFGSPAFGSAAAPSVPPPPATNLGGAIFGASTFGSPGQPQANSQSQTFGSGRGGDSAVGWSESNSVSGANTSASSSPSPFTNLRPSAQQSSPMSSFGARLGESSTHAPSSAFGSLDSARPIPTQLSSTNAAPVFGVSGLGSRPAPSFGSSTFGSTPASVAANKPVFGQTGFSAFANSASPFGIVSAQKQTSAFGAVPKDETTVDQSRPFAAFSTSGGSAFSAFDYNGGKTVSPFGTFADKYDKDNATTSPMETKPDESGKDAGVMVGQSFPQKSMPIYPLQPRQQEDNSEIGRLRERANVADTEKRASSVQTKVQNTTGPSQGKVVTGNYITDAMQRFPISPATENDHFPGLPPRPRSKMEQMYAYFARHNRQTLKPGMRNPDTGYVAFLQSAGDTYLPDVSDLTLEEKAAFEAKVCDLGNVPEIVPPLQYM